MLSRFRLHTRLRSLFGNSRLEDKMAEELRFHLVLATLVLITVAALPAICRQVAPHGWTRWTL